MRELVRSAQKMSRSYRVEETRSLVYNIEGNKNVYLYQRKVSVSTGKFIYNSYVENSSENFKPLNTDVQKKG